MSHPNSLIQNFNKHFQNFLFIQKKNKIYKIIFGYFITFWEKILTWNIQKFLLKFGIRNIITHPKSF